MEPCRNHAQAIGAVLDAKGFALESQGLIDDDVNSGRLCRLGDIEFFQAWSLSLASTQELIESGRGGALSGTVFKFR